MELPQRKNTEKNTEYPQGPFVIELQNKAHPANNSSYYKSVNDTCNSLLQKNRKTFVDRKSSDFEDAARKGDAYSQYKTSVT